MSNDEPMLGEKGKRSRHINSTLSAENIIQLIRSQSYGVLCTSIKDHSYGSLLAYSAIKDMSSLIFATPMTTRKYQLLIQNPHVAFLVDNRETHGDNFMQVEAVTAMGKATMLKKNKSNQKLLSHLSDKHPYLNNMLTADSFIPFQLQVERYFYVTRFQEVVEWSPPHKN